MAGGTFESDTDGTFQSDMGGTFGPLLSNRRVSNYLTEIEPSISTVYDTNDVDLLAYVYRMAKRTITDLAIDLIGGIRAFDDSIGPLSVTDSYPLSEMRTRFLLGISIICRWQVPRWPAICRLAEHLPTLIRHGT